MKSFVGLVQSFDTTPAAAMPQSFDGCFFGIGISRRLLLEFQDMLSLSFPPSQPLLDQPKAGHDPPSSGGRENPQREEEAFPVVDVAGTHQAMECPWHPMA